MRNSNLKVLGSTFMTLIKEKVRLGASEEEVMDLLTKYQKLCGKIVGKSVFEIKQ